MKMTNRGKLDDTLAAMFSNQEYSKTYLFYAHMIGQCSIIIDHDMPAPAGVAFMIDHYNLYINPTEFDKFTLVERLAVLKHEMLHILYNHVGRMEDRVHRTWNYATDCGLNQHIDEDHLPKQGITPENLGKMLNVHVPKNESAEFYYDLIKDTVKEQEKNGKGDGEEGADGEPKLLDDHGKWEESKGDADLQTDITKKMIEKSQEETIKGKGNTPSNISDLLSLHTRPSEVSWKKILRGVVGNKKVGKRPTIMRRDRRLPNRTELRGKTKDRVFNLLLIADVSGSMSDDAVTRTVGEVRYICDITKTDVDLIQVDTRALPPEKLSKKTKMFSRKACGGTYLYSAIEMAEAHNIDYQAVVVLTDGGLFTDDVQKFQTLNKKVIWLIEPNGTEMDFMNDGKMVSIMLKDV